MKVILTRDVKDTGRAHEVVEAADGHALNFLIPKKMAIPATAGALKEAELRRKQVASRKEVDAKLLAKSLETLADSRIVVKAKANEKGHLYDAVGEAEIVTAVSEQAHIDLPENVVRLEKPIKALGEFEVPVAAGEQFGKFQIVVEAE
jgi:large subunit ribosomal protein L9